MPQDALHPGALWDRTGCPSELPLLMSILISASRTVVAPRQFLSCFRAVSLDNLPRVNQRREVEADNVHLQFGSIIVGADR